MNAIYLTIILLIEIIVFVFVTKFDVLSSALWVAAMLFFTAAVYSINISIFGRDFTYSTVAVVSLTPICYFIGEFLGKKNSLKYINLKLKSKKYRDMEGRVLISGTIFIYLITIVIVLLGLYKLWKMFLYTKEIFGNTDILLTAYYIRSALTSGEYDDGTFIGLVSTMTEAAAFVFIYYYIYNTIFFRRTETKLLFPVAAYFFYLMTTTGRTGYIKFFIITIAVVYCMLSRSNKNLRYILKKAFKFILLAFLLILAIFYFYGYFIRKSTHNLSEYFVEYLSAGLYGLDDFIREPWKKNTLIGEYTLSNLYYWCNKLFMSDFHIPEYHLPFFSYKVGKSNIYTAFAFPIQDFGIIGMLFTRILIGYIFSKIRKKAIKEREISNHILVTVILGHLLYGNFFVVIADRYVELISVVSFPMLLVYIYIINKLFINSANRQIKIYNQKQKNRERILHG